MRRKDLRAALSRGRVTSRSSAEVRTHRGRSARTAACEDAPLRLVSRGWTGQVCRREGWVALAGGLIEESTVQLRGEGMDRASQFCVGLEFQLLFVEVVIRFGLLEGLLPVLADHDERGEENRLQRHNQRQHRGVHLISQLDHLTEPVTSIHRG